MRRKCRPPKSIQRRRIFSTKESINAHKMQASEKILYKCEKEGLQKVSKRRRGPPKSIKA
jgi:hypothetical protein